MGCSESRGAETAKQGLARRPPPSIKKDEEGTFRRAQPLPSVWVWGVGCLQPVLGASPIEGPPGPPFSLLGTVGTRLLEAGDGPCSVWPVLWVSRRCPAHVLMAPTGRGQGVDTDAPRAAW